MLIGELTVQRPGGGSARLTLDDRMTWRGDDPALVELARATCPGCGGVSDASAGRRLLFRAADRLGGRVRLAPPQEPLRMPAPATERPAAARRPAFIRSA
ncbi:MAG: hypothetical protein AAF288_06655 [Planctomycetota bacterium]